MKYTPFTRTMRLLRDVRWGDALRTLAVFSLPILVNSVIKLVLVLAIAGVGKGWRAALPLFCTALLIGGGMVWLSL